MEKKPNLLIHEKSPYLLQHAYNPVEWRPWGDEAFRVAQESGRPVFLSVGYSTCHWCHVMEHESFENETIAALMNRHFVNIKVDREERPDVDALYMTAVQAMTGAGGWPMSVFLTADRKPFYAGTYFPPDDRYGRPGFPSVLTQLADVWEKDRARVETSAGQIAEFLRDTLTRPSAPRDLPQPKAALEALVTQLRSQFDPENGGFGRAPKFPMPVYLEGLLAHNDVTGDASSLDMVTLTLSHIAAGGIYDQLGGGFARYSTDEKWVVPHFEKMLYDNAQLLAVAVEAHRRTADPSLERLVRRTAGYVLADLQHPGGGFYSAEDADSEGKEGAFYVWTLAEIRRLLDPADADQFIFRYGVTPTGNFFDPHTGDEGLNILISAKTIEETAAQFRKPVDEVRASLERSESRLREARARRPRPHRDEKILTEWNGLMISALARAAAWLGERAYREAAERAAGFLRTHLYDASARRLYRRWRDGERKIEGHQADYAFLIQGLLDLFEATASAEWLEWAIQLQAEQDQLFRDPAGGYFMTVPAPDLLVRMKDDGDNVIPSGNSIAARNGLRLAHLTGRDEFQAAGVATLKSFAALLTEQPSRLAAMAAVLPLAAMPPAHVVVMAAESPDGRALVAQARRSAASTVVVLGIPSESAIAPLASLLPFVRDLNGRNGKPTAFFCQNFACQSPTSDPAELRLQLEEARNRA